MRIQFAALATIVALASPALAQPAAISGGSTTVALDTTTLSSVGLNVTGAPGADGVINLPAGTTSAVAFNINPRDAATLPTTFRYTPGSFPTGGTFSGTIEHTGLVEFNDGATIVGDFTIGFDGARANMTTGDTGFFVESTTSVANGVAAILFDTRVKALDSQTNGVLDLTVDLVVSPEFAGFLGNNALIGTDVGDARIFGVPEPATATVALLGLLGVATRRRR